MEAFRYWDEETKQMSEEAKDGAIAMERYPKKSTENKPLYEQDLVQLVQYDGLLRNEYFGVLKKQDGTFVVEDLGEGIVKINEEKAHLFKLGNVYENPEMIKNLRRSISGYYCC